MKTAGGRRYDTINWYVRRENVSESSLKRLTLAIPHFKPALDIQSGLLVGSGSYRNLKVRITPKFVKVMGSVPVFLHKTNLKAIDLSEVASFFGFFAEILDVHLQDIIITRIDVAANLTMEHSAVCYFDYLGESTYMERRIWGSSLYYKQSNRKEYLLYDKNAEVHAKKGKAVNANLLRPELKLYKEIAVQMGMDIVTAADVCQKEFFNKLVEKWVCEYSRIEKIKPVVDFVDIMQITTPKSTRDCLFAQFLGERCKQNPLFITKLMQLLKQTGRYSNSTYYNLLKKDFEKLLDDYTVRKRSDLEKELTYKIYSEAKAA